MKPRPAAAPAIAALLAALLLAACGTPPPPAPKPPRSYVVLLENADGTTGKVVYRGQQGTVELDEAREAVALQGPAVTYKIDAQQLARDTSAAIAAQPRAPRTFIFYFDLNTTQLSPASEALVSQVQEELRSRQAPDVSITGHTDTAGDAARNETLALRRAEQVAQRLKATIASTVPVEVTSHGERNLLVQTPDDVDEPRNRRVEVVVR